MFQRFQHNLSFLALWLVCALPDFYSDVSQLNVSKDLLLQILVDLLHFARLLLDVLVHAGVLVVLGLMIDAL